MLPHELCTTLRNGSAARLREVCVPNSRQNLAVLSLLLKHGFITSVTQGTRAELKPAAFQKAGAANKRLWATLKYRNHRPVLKDIQLISRPSKKVIVSHPELSRLLTGRRAQFISPIGIGEIALLQTSDKGWIDGREALLRGIGGTLVLRAGS